jgi:hypothetical protein
MLEIHDQPVSSEGAPYPITYELSGDKSQA